MRVRVRIPTGFHTFLDPNSYFPESSIARAAELGEEEACTVQVLVGKRECGEARYSELRSRLCAGCVARQCPLLQYKRVLEYLSRYGIR